MNEYVLEAGLVADVLAAGRAMISSPGPGADILLNTQANNLAGAVSVGGTASNIRDFALRDVNAAATTPALSGLANLRNLILQFDNTARTTSGLARARSTNQLGNPFSSSVAYSAARAASSSLNLSAQPGVPIASSVIPAMPMLSSERI